MKVVIFAGGFGTRISEESMVMPKPMINIGEQPILWHIMKIYAHYGFREFVICCGYKGHLIKQYFSEYFARHADVTFDLGCNTVEVHNPPGEDWKVTCVDTGLNTMTGGRLKRVREFIGDDAFLLTYGDGVASVPIDQLVAYHRQQGGLATVTAVQPPGRFGALQVEDGRVSHFHEKPKGDGVFINGGFFVCEPQVLDLVDSDATVWEQEPMRRLVAADQLRAYPHDGFWQPMDTLRDKHVLEELWASEYPPWKVWQ